MTPEELEPKEGISRRKMLKRIGAGAAIAWTAPILTSIKTPSFATPIGPCSPDNCGCNGACNVAVACNGSSSCNCWLKADNTGCICAAFVQFCGDCGSCSVDADCAGGCACVQTCCGLTCAPTPCPPASCVSSGKNRSGLRTTK